MEKLKDIKGIVEVPDFSLYYFIAIDFAIIAFIVFLVFLFKTKKKPKPTKKEIALKILKNIDFLDTKKSVYDFCEHGALFVNENNQNSFQTIEKELQKYKYKKDVPNLDEESIKKMKDFIKDIK